MAEAAARVERDGRTWRLGSDAEVTWIRDGTTIDTTITAAIPPVFAAYATLVLPGARDGRGEHDRALLSLLHTWSADLPWWLGYLDTGGDRMVFPAAPRTTLYANWSYVLVEAGPQQAATWRQGTHCRSPLPDLIFPADRSWLASVLWDDTWRCLGGPAALVAAAALDPRLQARPVEPGQDATPPGHVSL